MLNNLKTFFLKAWLIEAIFLSVFTIIVTLSITVLTDSLYKVRIGKKVFETGKLTIVDSQGKQTTSNSSNQNPTNKSSGTQNNQTGNTSNSGQTTNTSSGGTTVTPPPTSSSSNPPPPTSTPPPSTPPPATPSGCFVTVNGYLYNMQSAIGVTLTDPNTGRKRAHNSGNFQCGSYSSPTNMTSIYLSKHSPMGCASRLAPYIYTPPAPKDPTC